MPCTPTPGGVDAEQRYSPSTGVEYIRHVGRRNNCVSVETPAAMSPPTRFGFWRSRFRRGEDGACEHPVAKPGSEPLDLRLDALPHVYGRGGRHVTVRPGRVLTSRRARRIEEARLDEQDERTIGNLAAPDLVLGARDLLERAAEVHGACARALRGAPGDGPVERPVHLEDARAVAVPLEQAPIRRRQPAPGHPQEGARRQVAEADARWHIVDGRDFGADRKLAPERPEIARKRVGKPLRTALREDPSMGVAERGQDESERRRRTSVERQHPVGRDAGKQRARVRRRKEARDARGGLQRAPPEPCDGQRVTRYSQRREHCIFEPRPCRDGRANRRAVDRRVRSESSGRCLDRPFQDRGGAVVQRVRDRARRFDPLDAVLAERHRSEKRRRAGKRVNGRADVVRESRQRQLGGSHAPADRVARLVDPHPAAGSREDDGRGQAVRPGTDDRRIQVGIHGALSENSVPVIGTR